MATSFFFPRTRKQVKFRMKMCNLVHIVLGIFLQRVHKIFCVFHILETLVLLLCMCGLLYSLTELLLLTITAD